MPPKVDITHIFFEPVMLLFEDLSKMFALPGWRCRQCGYQTLNAPRHLCTSYLN